MAKDTDRTPIFEALKEIISQYSDDLTLVKDTDDNYYLDTKFIAKNKKPMFFGAVTIRKSYVSYYLMPVYDNPDLTASISDALKKNRQGKSCFNFKTVDEALFHEMADVTKASFEDYVEKGFITKS